MSTTATSLTTASSTTAATSPTTALPAAATLPTSALPTTTTAAGRARYGGVEVIEVRDAEPLPRIGATDVLIRVGAAGLDRGVWHLMTGLPRLMRLAFGLRAPRRFTLGFDVAGTVVAVGSDVQRFGPGDDVFGIGVGTFANLAVAPEDKLVHRPRTVPVEIAGATPISGLTALQAVHDHGRIEAGQRVLVLGASGGVGSFAVQFAVATGAEVVGVASARKADFVRGLGAAEVLDYATTDVTAGDQRFDVIVDIGGLHRVRDLRRILSPTGTLVIVGGEGGGSWTGGIGRNLRAKVVSAFVSQRLTFFVSPENQRDLVRLRDALLDGSVTAAVTARYPLADVATAIADLEAGRIRGKAVMVP